MCHPGPAKDKQVKESNLQFKSTGQLSQTPKQQGEGCYITFGPQRACLVTQQISVLHIKQQIQSQPSFFWTMMSQRGHFMASPFSSRFCDDTGLEPSYMKKLPEIEFHTGDIQKGGWTKKRKHHTSQPPNSNMTSRTLALNFFGFVLF